MAGEDEGRSLGRRFWEDVWIAGGIQGGYGDDGLGNGGVCGGRVGGRDGMVCERDGEDGVEVSVALGEYLSDGGVLGRRIFGDVDQDQINGKLPSRC